MKRPKKAPFCTQPYAYGEFIKPRILFLCEKRIVRPNVSIDLEGMSQSPPLWVCCQIQSFFLISIKYIVCYANLVHSKAHYLSLHTFNAALQISVKLQVESIIPFKSFCKRFTLENPQSTLILITFYSC